LNDNSGVKYRELIKGCKKELDSHFKHCNIYDRPLFEYPLVKFSPPPVSRAALEEEYNKGSWQPIAKQILNCAKFKKISAVASGLSSDQNHKNVLNNFY
jgi:hypothetical protein